jgi:hypothetical protein
MTGEELVAFLRRRLPRFACEIRHGVVNGYVAAVIILPEKAEELIDATTEEEKEPEASSSREEGSRQGRTR